jgi:hypothetical protein
MSVNTQLRGDRLTIHDSRLGVYNARKWLS